MQPYNKIINSVSVQCFGVRWFVSFFSSSFKITLNYLRRYRNIVCMSKCTSEFFQTFFFKNKIYNRQFVIKMHSMKGRKLQTFHTFCPFTPTSRLKVQKKLNSHSMVFPVKNIIWKWYKSCYGSRNYICCCSQETLWCLQF